MRAKVSRRCRLKFFQKIQNARNWNSSIFPLVTTEVKFCLNVLAVLLNERVWARFDTTLAFLSNCFWMILLYAKILQRLNQIQCFLNCYCHALTFCLWWRKNNCGLHLDNPDNLYATSVDLEVIVRRWISVVHIRRLVWIIFNQIKTSLSCISKFETFCILNISLKLFSALPVLIGRCVHVSGQNFDSQRDVWPQMFDQTQWSNNASVASVDPLINIFVTIFRCLKFQNKVK